MRRRDLNRIWARTPGDNSAKGMGEQGIALISVILLILVLSFVSAAAIVTSTTELKIGGNFKTSAQSFYNAEAGVQYALGQIRKLDEDGTLNITGSTTVVNYAAPDTDIYPRLPDGNVPFSNWSTTQLNFKTGTTTLDYHFQTTGYYANSRTKLEVVLRMPSLVKGMFASGALRVMNNLRCVGSPAPEFGSNTSLENGNNGEFSKVVLGGSATYSGSAPKVESLPTPIPIELAPGAENMVSDHNYSGSHDNESVVGITGNKIIAPTSLPPGNYYLTDLNTSKLTISGSGAVNIYVETRLSLDNITINAGSGPLTIYYHGSADVDFESAVLNSGGIASNLSIISDWKDDLKEEDDHVLFDFKNNAVFSGLIYAPYADIDFQNNANVNGLLWGRTITAQNNLTVRYDATAASYFGGALIPRILTWKQIQSP